MPTTAQNNVAVPRVDRLSCPKTGSVDFNQGDILKVASKLVTPIAANTDTVIIGIADDTNPVASLGDDLTVVSVVLIGPYAGCPIVYLPVKNGDTPGFWDELYLSTTTAQEVSTTSGGPTQVGRCVELSTFTGDGTKRAKVLLCGAN